MTRPMRGADCRRAFPHGLDPKRSLGDDRFRDVDQVESAARRRHSRGPDWRIGSASRHGRRPAGAITTRVRTDS
jgi:hypothetical protein